MGTYIYKGSVETITIKKTGTYDITGYGAQGGSSSGGAGGKGAEVEGAFTLTAGETIEIVVGGAGKAGTPKTDDDGGGGGGGGTFILGKPSGASGYTLLLAAAGGNGAGNTNGGGAGAAGSAATAGGGAGGAYNGQGGGGAGINSAGQGGGTGTVAGRGGQNASGDWAGGAGGPGFSGGVAGGHGGFGGGGGGEGTGGGTGNGAAGGGGGGYSGGGDFGYAYSFDGGKPNAAHTISGKHAGSGDAVITFVAVCFSAGTLISTDRGDVAVESLAVGDMVTTASGACRPIRWLGHRTVDCRRHPSPREAMPIRVAAHAFGPNRPERDLYLSPGHSVCVDLYGEVLIPIGRLANGATIAQVDVAEVTYWHVELDAHDIILAENLPCESYIDCGTRAFFAESDVVDLAAAPDAPMLTTDDYYRPFHPEGALVDFARERLCLRANDLGWRLECPDPLGNLWLEVDGQRVVPHCDGLVARVTLPAAVRDIRLCSDVAVPAAIHGARDERKLGLQFASAVADDGLHWRCEMACTDERLADGFHTHEGTLRWTDGRARLPAELWYGARDMFVLRLAFAGPALPRWIAPADEVVAAADDVAA